MRIFSVLFRGVLEDLIAHAVVIFLFIFYYFVFPDYWFLCSLLTIIAAGAIKIFRSHKEKKYATKRKL